MHPAIAAREHPAVDRADHRAQVCLRLGAPFPARFDAHCFRLATIADYDLIIGMEGGRVVEVGKPDELLARGSSGSLFASLYSHM